MKAPKEQEAPLSFSSTDGAKVHQAIVALVKGNRDRIAYLNTLGALGPSKHLHRRSNHGEVPTMPTRCRVARCERA